MSVLPVFYDLTKIQSYNITCIQYYKCTFIHNYSRTWEACYSLFCYIKFSEICMWTSRSHTAVGLSAYKIRYVISLFISVLMDIFVLKLSRSFLLRGQLAIKCSTLSIVFGQCIDQINCIRWKAGRLCHGSKEDIWEAVTLACVHT